jgi:hypothetical protein
MEVRDILERTVWPLHMPAMLKPTAFLTTTHFSHAKKHFCITTHISHTGTNMLTTNHANNHESNAKTLIVDHGTFQSCGNDRFYHMYQPCWIQRLTTTHSSHAVTNIFTTTQATMLKPMFGLMTMTHASLDVRNNLFILWNNSASSIYFLFAPGLQTI